MKTTLLTFLILITVLPVTVAQHSCCLPMNGEMAMLKDPAFIAAHADPLPFNYTPAGGGMMTFNTPDGKKANGFYANAGTKDVILMFHEWWGLNNYIKREAERWSDALGVSVLAVDMFDGAVAATAEDASKLTQNADEERIRTIIAGAIDFLGKESRIQTVGWCFGGKWSLQAAMQAGPNTTGCIMYYGAPETDKTKLATINFPVLGIFAKKDGWITPAMVSEFESVMKELKKQVTIIQYDAVHAFANPSNPDHDKSAAADAETKTMKFIKLNMEKFK